MVFVKKKNDCGMAAKWILGNKKGRRMENAARNKTERKHSEDIKGIYSRCAAERRITGRFAKRFSGERPVSLGFELTFLSKFK